MAADAGRGDTPYPELPPDLTVSLTNTAEQIETLRNLLPENQITRSDVSMVHLISDADLVKLRFAGRVSVLTNAVQMWIGAAIGLSIPGIAAGVSWYNKGNLAALTTVDQLTLIGFAICVGVSATLQHTKAGQEITVDQLCDQIEGRPRKKTPLNG